MFYIKWTIIQLACLYSTDGFKKVQNNFSSHSFDRKPKTQVLSKLDYNRFSGLNAKDTDIQTFCKNNTLSNILLVPRTVISTENSKMISLRSVYSFSILKYNVRKYMLLMTVLLQANSYLYHFCIL